jgi:hypothetical protein
MDRSTIVPPFEHLCVGSLLALWVGVGCGGSVDAQDTESSADGGDTDGDDGTGSYRLDIPGVPDAPPSPEPDPEPKCSSIGTLAPLEDRLLWTSTHPSSLSAPVAVEGGGALVLARDLDETRFERIDMSGETVWSEHVHTGDVLIRDTDGDRGVGIVAVGQADGENRKWSIDPDGIDPEVESLGSVEWGGDECPDETNATGIAIAGEGRSVLAWSHLHDGEPDHPENGGCLYQASHWLSVSGPTQDFGFGTDGEVREVELVPGGAIVFTSGESLSRYEADGTFAWEERVGVQPYVWPRLVEPVGDDVVFVSGSATPEHLEHRTAYNWTFFDDQLVWSQAAAACEGYSLGMWTLAHPDGTTYWAAGVDNEDTDEYRTWIHRLSPGGELEWVAESEEYVGIAGGVVGPDGDILMVGREYTGGEYVGWIAKLAH